MGLVVTVLQMWRVITVLQRGRVVTVLQMGMVVTVLQTSGFVNTRFIWSAGMIYPVPGTFTEILFTVVSFVDSWTETYLVQHCLPCSAAEVRRERACAGTQWNRLEGWGGAGGGGTEQGSRGGEEQ